MNRRVALMTSNPRLVGPFLHAVDARGGSGFELPLCILVRPSMRYPDRVRDLADAIRRQARINDTWRAAQLVHHLAYRWLARTKDTNSPEAAADVFGSDRIAVEAPSGNDPAVAAALREADCSLCVMVGGDVLTRRTLAGAGVRFVNVHMGDPAFVRGKPAMFWEILGGRASIDLTLHEAIAKVDAGTIVLRRESPILWGPSLGETLRRTRERAAAEIAVLLLEGIPLALAGASSARDSTPGPLRTTPTVWQTLRADRICRRRCR
jgi:hypothetical protein